MGDIIKFPGSKNDEEDYAYIPATDLLRHCVSIAFMQEEIDNEVLEQLVDLLDAVDKLLEEDNDD